MRLSNLRLLTPLIGAITGARCTTEVCACPPAFAAALVYGQVTSAAGEPVPGALVRAYSAPAPGCHTGGPDGLDYGVIPAGADGTFSMGLPGAQAQDSICVFVFARPAPDDEGLTASDTTLVILDFRYDEPQDSARVDPVLRPLN